MKYDSINPGDVVILRSPERDVVAQVDSKYKWRDRKARGETVEVKLQSGALIACDPSSLLTLSEAQNRPLKASGPQDERPPR